MAPSTAPRQPYLFCPVLRRALCYGSRAFSRLVCVGAAEGWAGSLAGRRGLGTWVGNQRRQTQPYLFSRPAPSTRAASALQLASLAARVCVWVSVYVCVHNVLTSKVCVCRLGVNVTPKCSAMVSKEEQQELLSATSAPHSATSVTAPQVTATLTHVPPVGGPPITAQGIPQIRTFSAEQANELSVLKWKIQKLPYLYLLLFGLSLMTEVIVLTTPGTNKRAGMTFCFLFLFAASCTIFYRRSLVNKYYVALRGDLSIIV